MMKTKILNSILILCFSMLLTGCAKEVQNAIVNNTPQLFGKNETVIAKQPQPELVLPAEAEPFKALGMTCGYPTGESFVCEKLENRELNSISYYFFENICQSKGGEWVTYLPGRGNAGALKAREEIRRIYNFFGYCKINGSLKWFAGKNTTYFSNDKKNLGVVDKWNFLIPMGIYNLQERYMVGYGAPYIDSFKALYFSDAERQIEIKKADEKQKEQQKAIEAENKIKAEKEQAMKEQEALRKKKIKQQEEEQKSQKNKQDQLKV